MRAGQRHGSVLGGTAEFADGLQLRRREQLESLQEAEEIGLSNGSQLLEERRLLVSLVQPALPTLFELVLDLRRETPERHASERVEQLVAPSPRHGEHDMCLGEVVRVGKSSGQNYLPAWSQEALSVPPTGEIHLADPGDHQAQA